MADLYAAFQEAAGVDENPTIVNPGAAGIDFILQSHKFKTSLEKVQKVFDDMEWDEQCSLSWSDFQRLAVRLGIDEAEETANGSEEDRADELAQSVSGVVDAIAARIAENKFPYVLA